MAASGSVGQAFGMVVGAGAASSLGALVVCCVSLASPRVVASSLGFAGGVMLYVVFTEILSRKSIGGFEDAGHSEAASFRLSTACFFGGILATALLDVAVHSLMHWAAHRQQRRVASRMSRSKGTGTSSLSTAQTGKDACSSAGTADLLYSSAVPPGDSAQPLPLPSSAAGGLVHGHCACCTASAASLALPGVSCVSEAGSEHGDIETGGSVASCGDAAPCCSTPEACCRRNPDCCGACCVGNPDCCGPTARCYNTGAGEAAVEIAPGTAPAEVVAVLQNDPHTRDLLRMGIFTGLAIALHNIPEGLATFVGALNDSKVGASIAVAIAIHNVPEGICVAMPIYYATGSRWKGFIWGSLTGLAEPLGGLLGYLVLQEENPLSFAIVFGIVAGMMVYVSVKELLPSAFRFDPKDKVASTSVLVGMAVMALSLVLFTL